MNKRENEWRSKRTDPINVNYVIVTNIVCNVYGDGLATPVMFTIKIIFTKLYNIAIIYQLLNIIIIMRKYIYTMTVLQFLSN